MKNLLRYMDNTHCKQDGCKAVLACNCCTVTYRQIDEVIYHAKEYVAVLSTKHNLYLKTGIGSDRPGLITKISNYIWAMERELELIYRGIKSCLKESAICDLVEKVKGLLPMSCYPKKRRDSIIDKSQFEKWLSQNTGCVPFESYTKLLYKICNNFSITVERESFVKGTNVCDFSIGILREHIPKELVYSLKRSPRNCKIEAKVTRQDLSKRCDLVFDLQQLEECEFKYNLLKEKYDCSMTAALYVELIKCGFSHEFIDQSVKCGFDVCIKDYKTDCKMDFQEYTTPVLCDINYDQYCMNKDVCLENNSITYNVTSINFE